MAELLYCPDFYTHSHWTGHCLGLLLLFLQGYNRRTCLNRATRSHAGNTKRPAWFSYRQEAVQVGCVNLIYFTCYNCHTTTTNLIAASSSAECITHTQADVGSVCVDCHCQRASLLPSCVLIHLTPQQNVHTSKYRSYP